MKCHKMPRLPSKLQECDSAAGRSLRESGQGGRPPNWLFRLGFLIMNCCGALPMKTLHPLATSLFYQFISLLTLSRRTWHPLLHLPCSSGERVPLCTAGAELRTTQGQQGKVPRDRFSGPDRQTLSSGQK